MEEVKAGLKGKGGKKLKCITKKNVGAKSWTKGAEEEQGAGPGKEEGINTNETKRSVSLYLLKTCHILLA